MVGLFGHRALVHKETPMGYMNFAEVSSVLHRLNREEAHTLGWYREYPSGLNKPRSHL